MRLNTLALSLLSILLSALLSPPVSAQFTAADIGGPSLAGSSSAAGNGYNVTGAGTDIFGVADQFQFNYTQYTGDFDVRIRVQSFNASDVWAKAGLMAREDLIGGGRYAAAFATPGISGSFLQNRVAVSGTTTNNGSFPSTYPNTWLRLRRSVNVFTAFASIDGNSWQQLASISVALSNALYVGMAVTSRNPGQLATAEFRDFGDVANNPPTLSQRLKREPIGPSSRKTGLIISEIMYHPRTISGLNGSLEFVEIFNTQPWDERIAGYRISGSVDYVFPPGTVVRGGSYLVVARDPAAVQSHYGISGVLGPWNGATTNNLPGAQGTVRLRNRQGAVMLEVNYEGRNPWPVAADGAGHSLALARPSYGEGDARAWTASDSIDGSPGKAEPFNASPLDAVVINEFLAHTDPPLEDYVELYNHSNVPVDLSGAYLTDEADTNKFRIPNGTTIPARGFVFFTQTTLGFALSAAGERIYLVNSNQTRVIDAIDFEPQLNGVSTGRVPDGSTDFYPLATRTPGAANGGPRQSEVVINEIMYNPITGNNNDEYVELYNRTASPVNIGGWKFVSGISYTFPSNTVIAPGGYLVVAENLTNLLAHYPGVLTSANTIGNYGGSLGNAGERLALAMPDALVSTNTNTMTLVTNTIYVVVNEVTYGDGGRWGNWSDGGGSSLELVDPNSDNRQAANWAESDETSKSQWTSFEYNGPSGAPPTSETLSFNGDRVQVFLLGIGECLLDEVEVRVGGGTNLVANPGFESGTNSWLLQGSHDFSTIENVGFAGSKSLHLRAASRGDNGANRLQNFLTASAAGNVTLRGKARWLRGWPEVLIRLRGGGAEAFGKLALPKNLGTPGAANSRRITNAGPAIYNVQHFPSLPQASNNVVVTAQATDPNGIAALRLKYRLDSGNFNVTPALFTSVTMVDDGTGGDAITGDGIYSGTIPGQPGGGLASFYLEAVDNLGATNLFPQDVFPPPGLPRCFPNDAPTRECVVRWGDIQMTGNFPTYHMWISSVSSNRWHTRAPALNNSTMDATFVLNNYRVIYNMLPLYAGSPWHRGQMTTGPAGANRVDYVMNYPVDDRLFGATDSVVNNPGNPGAAATSDHSAQTEQTSYFIFNEIGLVYNHRKYVHVFVNGNQRSTADLSGNFILEDSQQPNADMIEEWYPGNTDGQFFKIEDWFEFPDNGFDFTSNNDADLSRRTVLLNGVQTLYPAPYRFMFRPRAVSPGESANDYGNFFRLVDAASPTPAYSPSGSSATAQIPDPGALDSIANVEQWMRIFAVQRTVGNWDSYGYSRGKNDYAYMPKGGRFEQLTWDIDFTMGVGGNGASQALFDSVNDPRCTGMYSTPVFTRMYYRAFLDIINGPLNGAAMNPILDAKQAALVANRVNADNAFVNTIKTYTTQRRAFIQGELNKVSPPFSMSATNDITTSNNVLVLRGAAPIVIQDLYVNGVPYPVTWSAPSSTYATNWTLRIVLSAGTNVITIQGYDRLGTPLTNAIRTLTAVYTGTDPDPKGAVVFNEIQYNPAVPGASFVELYNNSASSFDLSDWRINGLDYIFPTGSIITNGQYLVLVKNRSAFSAAYGGTVVAFDSFDGSLDLDGETLTLIKPSTNGAPDLVIDKVRYEAQAPWAPAANGTGASLQLADAKQDNARVSNWGAGYGWQLASRTGNIANGTNILLWLTQAGNAYIDDISLVGPEGTNVLVNGGFESGTDPWIIGTSYASSVVVEGISHSGTHSLFLNGTGPGGSFPNNLIQQVVAGAITQSNVYTLSFYALYNTNSVTINARGLPGNNITTNLITAPIQSTPGALNLFVQNLPPYDPVWLNEVQPNNVSGITDNNGEHDPWIELYNGGTNTLDLNGYFLANNYTSNLTQWPFPAGSSIRPGEFRIVWADGQPAQTSGTNLHTSFRLAPASGSLALVRLVDGKPQITDYLNYSSVGANLSYGDYPDGQPFNRVVMFNATPGGTNIARDINVFVNEWMAGNTNFIADPSSLPGAPEFDDWFELYNAGNDPVDLGGFYLTDNLNNRNQFLIPTNGQYVIPPKGFLLVWADNQPEQNGPAVPDLHVNFQLRAAGEEIGLFDADGSTIDAVVFGNQTNDVSQGRFSDGSPNIYYMTTPTPRAANTLSLGNNNPPTLAAIPDWFVPLGQSVNFVASATDPDPGQTLTFSLLPGFPPGASINPGTGQFQWTPTPAQSPSTNHLTIEIADNGVPRETDTRSFNIVVAPAPTLTISGNNVSMSFPTIPGKTYRVDYKNSLSDPVWIQLAPAAVAGTTSLGANDTLGASPQRFYRIVQLD
jgi:hypothetical protein